MNLNKKKSGKVYLNICAKFMIIKTLQNKKQKLPVPIENVYFLL